tara:strand:+ start:148 stop:363 length:216 start_codon:yes stop_codon:yes gene_type:complete
MTSTTAKKPRPARRRKAKAITSETYEVANKLSNKQLPVVITEESLTLLDYSILSILYLEKFIKVILNRFSH